MRSKTLKLCFGESSDLIIIAVTLHRFEPYVSHLQSLKESVWNKFQRPLIRFDAYSRYCYYKIRGFSEIIL